MADLQTIGRALQGLSAGIGGQLPQFTEGLRRQELQGQQQEQRISKERFQALGQDWVSVAGFLGRGDFDGALGVAQNRVDVLGESGGDATESAQLRDEILAAQQDPSRLSNLIGKVNDDIKGLVASKLFDGSALGLGGQSGLGAEQRAFEANIAGLSPADQTRARRVKLRLDAGAVGSSAITLAGQEPGAAQAVADVEEKISAGRERGRQRTQLKFKPQIAKAVKLAQSEATARGETLTDVARAKAALPGLRDVVADLRELAPLVTSTVGGRIFDAAVKETGFGSTKGATARAKWIAIADNQVLPLLKQTFGAAFTESEGKALKATLGDPDATEDAKLAQLDAFIESKEREIADKERTVGEIGAAFSVIDASDEDLLNF